jgi:hypothetical protein
VSLVRSAVREELESSNEQICAAFETTVCRRLEDSRQREQIAFGQVSTLQKAALQKAYDANAEAVQREKEVAKEKIEDKDKFFDFYVKKSEAHFDQFQKQTSSSQAIMLSEMTLIRESGAVERDKDRKASCELLTLAINAGKSSAKDLDRQEKKKMKKKQKKLQKEQMKRDQDKKDFILLQIELAKLQQQNLTLQQQQTGSTKSRKRALSELSDLSSTDSEDENSTV